MQVYVHKHNYIIHHFMCICKYYTNAGSNHQQYNSFANNMLLHLKRVLNYSIFPCRKHDDFNKVMTNGTSSSSND